MNFELHTFTVVSSCNVFVKFSVQNVMCNIQHTPAQFLWEPFGTASFFFFLICDYNPQLATMVPRAKIGTPLV